MTNRPVAKPGTPVSLRPLLALACCALLTLAACENQPLPGVNPTPASAPQALPPPSATVDTTTTVTTTTATTSSGEEVITVEETEVVVEETEPAVSSEQREADIADCYAFSRSQVQHDIDVQEDSATVVDSTVNPGFTAFTQELDDYGNEKRRGQLFDNCMVAKGYAEDGY